MFIVHKGTEGEGRSYIIRVAETWENKGLLSETVGWWTEDFQFSLRNT